MSRSRDKHSNFMFYEARALTYYFFKIIISILKKKKKKKKKKLFIAFI